MLVSVTPALGHFNPVVPLTRALVALGWEVAVATATAFEDTVAAAGLPCAAIEPEPAVSPLTPLLPGLERFATVFRPDVVMHEPLEFAGPRVAAALGIPAVEHGIGGRYARQAAVAARAGGSVPMQPRAALHVVPPRLPLAPPSAETVLALRPVPYAAGPAAVDTPEAGPNVLVTLGTVFHDPALLRRLADAVRHAGGNPVVLLGAHDSEAAGTAHVVYADVDQRSLAGRIRAVVCHGGWNTVIWALSERLPLVVVPIGADHFDNAAAVCAVGAGIEVGRHAPGTELRQAVRAALTEPSLAAGAADVADDIAAMPPPDEVAAVLTELVVHGGISPPGPERGTTRRE